MIAPVRREADEPRSDSAKTTERRKRESLVFGWILIDAFWIYATLTYLWDAADHARLAQLILFSVLLGFSLGQLPPLKSLLRSRWPRRNADSED